MKQVKTPVEGYTGTVAGVTFDKGVGETDNPSALAYFERHGYKVEPDEESKPDEAEAVADWLAAEAKWKAGQEADAATSKPAGPEESKPETPTKPAPKA